MNILLRNARRYGGDDRLDVLLRDGRIALVGPAGSVAAGDAEPVDLDGRYAGPGLWDEHLHFSQWVVQSRRFDLSPARSAVQALDMVGAELKRSPRTLFTGYGFRDGLWPDKPSLAALDAVAGDTAVILVSGDLHCGWISSNGARWLGVEVGEEGLLREADWIHAQQKFGDEAPDISVYIEAADAAARRGVVGMVELEVTDNAAEWPGRVEQGVDALRIEAATWPHLLDDTIGRGLRTGQPLGPSGLVHFGRLKVVVDGSLNTRTAWCCDPYPGTEDFGVTTVEPARLESLLKTAHAAGIAPAVHAIGDRAVGETLDVYERLGITGTIEHVQLVAEKDFPRFQALGVVAGIQPEHAMDDRDVADRVWPGRTDRVYAYGSLHAAGATLRLGSDAPVAPLDPWFAIASAVYRSRGDREPWNPGQCLPPEVAMAGSARGRLHLKAGDVADVVIVEEDPLHADRDRLRTMPVAGTLLGGRWTWRGL